MMGPPVPRLRPRRRPAGALAIAAGGRRHPRGAADRPAGTAAPGATSSTRTSCRGGTRRARRSSRRRAGTARSTASSRSPAPTGSGSAGRARCRSRRCRSARRSRSAGAPPRASPPPSAHRPEVGRAVRGVGGPQGAAGGRDRRRPDGRPDGLHPPPVAARPGLPARGAPRDPPHRADGARAALRQPLHRQRRAGGDPDPARQGPGDAVRAAPGTRLPPRHRLRRCPTRRRGPASSAREGLRWLAWTRFSGDRFFAMKAEQAAPDPPPRPRRAV